MRHVLSRRLLACSVIQTTRLSLAGRSSIGGRALNRPARTSWSKASGPSTIGLGEEGEALDWIAEGWALNSG
jgi:hypothetical protein